MATQYQPSAILSVYDKTGLLDLAKGLSSKGVRLLGSGGTAKLVREAGLEIRCVSAVRLAIPFSPCYLQRCFGYHKGT